MRSITPFSSDSDKGCSKRSSFRAQPVTQRAIISAWRYALFKRCTPVSNFIQCLALESVCKLQSVELIKHSGENIRLSAVVLASSVLHEYCSRLPQLCKLELRSRDLMNKSVQELLSWRLAHPIAFELIATCAGRNKVPGEHTELRVLT